MDARWASRMWMYDHIDTEKRFLKESLCVGLTEFIIFVINQDVHLNNGDKIRCLCQKRKNFKFHPHKVVSRYLIRRGFQQGYWNWIAQGKPIWIADNNAGTSAQVNQENLPDEIQQWGNYKEMTWDQRMVFYAAVPMFEGNIRNDEAVDIEYERDPFEGQQVTQLDERWRDVSAANRPLFTSRRTHTLMSFVASLLYAKSEWSLSEAAFNYFNELFQDIMPEENMCPANYHHHRKAINDFSLPVIKINACPNGCMLFWKEHIDDDHCVWCGAERYEERIRCSDGKRKRIPHAFLRYLPLGPRLQRLFTTNRIAENMTWHANLQRTSGLMWHPSDSEAWQHFDRIYLDFTSEPRNVRLRLCTDGFSPHDQFGKIYSCWPVIVTPYNLPLGMCIKSEHMFLTLICPGPKNPKKNIDVFLQPLIDELNALWNG